MCMWESVSVFRESSIFIFRKWFDTITDKHIHMFATSYLEMSWTWLLVLGREAMSDVCLERCCPLGRDVHVVALKLSIEE